VCAVAALSVLASLSDCRITAVSFQNLQTTSITWAHLILVSTSCTLV